MATTLITKYNSVIKTLSRALPSWVNDSDDAVRVAAYDAYDDMYRNVPDTFAVALRGEEDQPIYVPSSKRIIEATNRYLAKNWAWTVSSASENDRMALQKYLFDLFTREEMTTKFYSIKRNSLKEGDALIHITVNAAAPAGQRLSISEINPRQYFRIPDPVNIEKATGCYIVQLLYADDGTTQISQRLEYKFTATGTVSTRMSFYEPDGWDDRWVGHPPLKPTVTPAVYATNPGMQPLLAGFELPASVTAIPVYHIRNNREGGDPWGGSELAGMETLIAAINQGASDEDITLALQGLGIYTTTAVAPVDSDGAETDWIIQPGYVLELKPGQTFNRVDGVKSLVPYQEHLAYLGTKLDESSGLSKVAIGNVDVQVAQSGIALRLDMAPILAKNEEKEAELLAKLDQFLHDLVFMWAPVDGFTPAPDAIVINSFGDPLPLDRSAVISEITTLVAAQLMSKEFAVAYLTAKLGYQFPVDMLSTIFDEQDSVMARLAGELGGSAADIQPPGVDNPNDISTGSTAGVAPPGTPRPSVQPTVPAPVA